MIPREIENELLACASEYPAVTIFRRTANPSEPILKLPCKYSSKTDKISLETDYAVMPGDKIVVEAGRDPRLDDVFGPILGPLLGG